MRRVRIPVILAGILAASAYADEFDRLRAKCVENLTGGSAIDSSIPQVRQYLTLLETEAAKSWRDLDKSGGRTALWHDMGNATAAEQISRSWYRLRRLGIAWGTPGERLYGDRALLADVRAAMLWLERNRYNARVASFQNWWHWEIGSPLALDDLLLLLHDQLTPGEIAEYSAAIERFAGDPRVIVFTGGKSTGANRVWKCRVAALHAIATKDGAKLRLASDALGPVFAYVTHGDGFYEDGSFIMHGRYPYNGGYGKALLEDMADLTSLLAGSPWEVRDPRRDNLYRWVFDAFQPLIWRGAMMDMVRGREISRVKSSDHAAGQETTAAILRVAQFAPPAQARRMRSMLKGWYLADTATDPYAERAVGQIREIRAILADRSIEPSRELTGTWIFAGMDRVVHRRPGWAFGIAMHSTRIANFESNTENLHGWHTADGMTYLYTSDLTQFSGPFWPTVDPYRLPGTTVIAGSEVATKRPGGSSIAGGASLDGFGAVMMDLRPAGQDLQAKKSWFLLDGEVVAVGSGIHASKPVETVVENRRLTGDPKFAVADDRRWAHLDPDLGYFFPDGGGWKWERKDRQGSWREINSEGPAAPINARYHTIWFDRGDAYTYALVPGRSRAEMEAYAAAPHFRVVERSEAVHMVEAATQGIRAATFWSGRPESAGGIRCDGVAAIVVRKAGGVIAIGVADPTQLGETIHVELDEPAVRVIEADAAVHVEQFAPAIRLSVRVKDARGRTLRVRLAQP